jgi:hypothetical protein
LPQRDEFLVNRARCNKTSRRSIVVERYRFLGPSFNEAIHKTGVDVAERKVGSKNAVEDAALLSIHLPGILGQFPSAKLSEETDYRAAERRGLRGCVIGIGPVTLPALGNEQGGPARRATGAPPERLPLPGETAPPVLATFEESHGSLLSLLNQYQKSSSETRSSVPTLRKRISRLMST